jgi:hypothetical protein
VWTSHGDVGRDAHRVPPGEAAVERPDVAVTGQVIHETEGLLGVRNLLEVEYSAGGRRRTATIPVKGDGFGGVRTRPYFYEPGDQVRLLVDSNNPSSVRTEARWTPAVHNWGAVTGFFVALLLVVVVLRAVSLRALRESAAADLSMQDSEPTTS